MINFTNLLFVCCMMIEEDCSMLANYSFMLSIAIAFPVGLNLDVLFATRDECLEHWKHQVVGFNSFLSQDQLCSTPQHSFWSIHCQHTFNAPVSCIQLATTTLFFFNQSKVATAVSCVCVCVCYHCTSIECSQYKND